MLVPLMAARACNIPCACPAPLHGCHPCRLATAHTPALVLAQNILGPWSTAVSRRRDLRVRPRRSCMALNSTAACRSTPSMQRHLPTEARAAAGAAAAPSATRCPASVPERLSARVRCSCKRACGGTCACTQIRGKYRVLEEGGTAVRRQAWEFATALASVFKVWQETE